MVTLLVVYGLSRLPAIFGFNLPGWFTLFWLLLALCVLLAHLEGAHIIGRPSAPPEKERKKSQL